MIRKIKLFNQKFKNHEIFRPIKDYSKIQLSKSINRNAILISILTIVCIILIISSNKSKNCILELYKKLVDAEINFVSLLLSFSIAYLTRLITASGNSIECLKSTLSDIKIDSSLISLYQILLIELTFTIYLEIILLAILILNNFLFLYNEIFIKSMFFMLEIILLFEVIVILINLIKNIYFSFWNN